MPRELLIALGGEVLLVLLTCTFLLKPSNEGARNKTMWMSAGVMSLCLTFCWSVVLGCVYALHSLQYRI